VARGELLSSFFSRVSDSLYHGDFYQTGSLNAVDRVKLGDFGHGFRTKQLAPGAGGAAAGLGPGLQVMVVGWWVVCGDFGGGGPDQKHTQSSMACFKLLEKQETENNTLRLETYFI
jgi:hypothetical protein